MPNAQPHIVQHTQKKFIKKFANQKMIVKTLQKYFAIFVQVNFEVYRKHWSKTKQNKIGTEKLFQLIGSNSFNLTLIVRSPEVVKGQNH